MLLTFLLLTFSLRNIRFGGTLWKLEPCYFYDYKLHRQFLFYCNLMTAKYIHA